MSLWSSSATLIACSIRNSKSANVRPQHCSRLCVGIADMKRCWRLQSGGTMSLYESSSATLTSCTIDNSRAGLVRKHALERDVPTC